MFLLRFLVGVEESGVDVEVIDAVAATAAEDDEVAAPSVAQISEGGESIRLEGETLVEGLELGAKLESESSAIIVNAAHV